MTLVSIDSWARLLLPARRLAVVDVETLERRGAGDRGADAEGDRSAIVAGEGPGGDQRREDQNATKNCHERFEP